ncbi:hypothetical protein [Mycetocola spongiae]|uniref:hypothetical protein n=1 Tax=Mycetocola spongiae TaxID=2859226 RepID=UPI001CF1B452|nr:hypothetical protein [Mycetocola spongiae]UCR88309.1 hypothetical protein KXZ72_10025 [Mycetocola spongiae]
MPTDQESFRVHPPRPAPPTPQANPRTYSVGIDIAPWLDASAASPTRPLAPGDH